MGNTGAKFELGKSICPMISGPSPNLDLTSIPDWVFLSSLFIFCLKTEDRFILLVEFSGPKEEINPEKPFTVGPRDSCSFSQLSQVFGLPISS